jgi:hypothetical protein
MGNWNYERKCNDCGRITRKRKHKKCPGCGGEFISITDELHKITAQPNTTPTPLNISAYSIVDY